MTYRITIRKEDGIPKEYIRTGNRDRLMDAAYRIPGARGVAVMVLP